MMKKYPKINATYKHYKGGLYQVITLANCTDRNIPVVVYKSLLFGSVYTRELDEWFEEVKPEGSTEVVERFTEHNEIWSW
jgi:hypothetical protein